jgi:2-polyprenyl-3-methyl-5-hydroxy-6-metoxy-1,4-benzoquinol methylase
MHARELTERYTDEGDVSRAVLLNPALFELLGPVSGKAVLDAGCGEGYLCRMLAKRGANVLGVDASREMLRIAVERTRASLDVRYVRASCENLGFLPEQAFDAVVSNMVVQDVANYEAALSELRRVLRPDGLLVFSVLHPCFTPPGSGWVRDAEGRRLHWKVDNYFEEGAYEQPYPPQAEQGVIGYHRTLSSYFRAIRDAGLAVDDLVEPRPSAEVIEEDPGWRNDLRMCNFLVFACSRA